MTALVWWWRRHMARHRVWAADLQFRRDGLPTSAAAWARAVDQLHRIELRP